MRRLAILALALALTTQSIATAAKPPRPREAVATIAVTVSRGGGPAVGLTADDFVVVVDGGSLDPITVEPPLPLAVLVLIDQSESMRPPTRGPGRPLDGELSGALKPGDSVRFGRIGNGVTIDPPVPGITQKDLRNAIKAWPDPEEFAPSPLWDGVLQASRAFGDTSHRHLITLVTDGRSTANHASAEDAARAAIQARAAVSIIDEGRTSVINQDNRNAVAVRSSPVLEWLCQIGRAHV